MAPGLLTLPLAVVLAGSGALAVDIGGAGRVPAVRRAVAAEVTTPPPQQPPSSTPVQEAVWQVSSGCWRMLRKAKDLIDFDVKTRKEQGLPPLHFQEQAAEELDVQVDGKVTLLNLQHAEAALGAVTLARALQWGSVWSSEDQQALHRQCTGEKRQPLEENAKTDTGDQIVQGDMVSARCDERLSGDGASYRGCQTRTRGGLRCQHWDAQSPHAHAWQPDGHTSHDLSENFCRNPNGQKSIWCFTVSSGTRWDFCDPLYLASNLTEPLEPSTSQGIWASGTVRYCYDKDVDHLAQVSLERAMRALAKQVPCIHFRKVAQRDRLNCAELPSVLVRSIGKGCWSHVGQVSGFEDRFKTRSQLLNLGPGCGLQGMAAHQLGQLLGLRHEVNRPDRNDYLDLFEENANGDINVLFPTGPPSTLPPKASGGRAFDLLSVMMSGPHSFGRNKSVATLQPKAEPLLRRYMGQRMGFSHFDILRLADLYGCLEEAEPESETGKLSELFLQGQGMQADEVCRDQDYTGVSYVDGTGIPKPYWCADLAGKCNDVSMGQRLRRACARTCLQCTPAISGKLAPEAHGNEEEVLKVRAVPVPVNATLDLVPPDGCEDGRWTGFRFRDGREAHCADLQSVCEHHVLGKQAKQACPKTCGLCGAPIVEAASEGDANCHDAPKDAAPIFTMWGEAANCTQLKSYCNSSHEDAVLVVQKCRLTCGACEPLPAAVRSRNGTSGAALSTTTPWSFSTSVTDGLSSASNCARRRRWGFCATRRRRME